MRVRLIKVAEIRVVLRNHRRLESPTVKRNTPTEGVGKVSARCRQGVGQGAIVGQVGDYAIMRVAITFFVTLVFLRKLRHPVTK